LRSFGRILNGKELSTSPDRKQLVRILEAGLKAADPKRLVADVLKKSSEELAQAKRFYVIGFGKGSQLMAEGCESSLGGRIDDGAVIAPAGSPGPSLTRIKVLRGTHPLPSRRSLEATKELLKIVSGLRKDDVVVCLISGGGSGAVLPSGSRDLRGGSRGVDGVAA
jgi:hydroxypyruvate reductase